LRPERCSIAASTLAVGLTLLIAGCTTIDDISKYIEDDDEIFGSDATPDADEPYRTLGEAPDEAPEGLSALERNAVAEGLVADRDKARYTDEELRNRYETEAEDGAAFEPVEQPEEEEAVAQTEPSDEPFEEPAEAAVASAEPDPAVPAEPEPVIPATPEAAPPSDTAVTVPIIEPASRAVLESRERADAVRDTPAARARRRDSEYGTGTVRTQDPVREPVQEQAEIPREVLPEIPEPAPAPQRQTATADVPLPTQAAPQPVARAANPDTISGFKSQFTEQFNASGGMLRTAPNPQLPRSDSVLDPAPAPQGPQRTDALIAAIPDPLPRAASAELVTVASSETRSVNGAPAVFFQAGTIFFNDGSSRLSNADKAKLKQIAALQRDHGAQLRVVGHASQRTKDMPTERHKLANFSISLDRANAVSRALLDYGVPAGAIAVTAASDSQPVAFEYMPRGEAQNRRAEVFIEY
jgi:outer membrane protein OmpA-like peptidoglycan-associated protein